MARPTIDSKRRSGEAHLLVSVDRYARLVRKADTGRLQGDELDQLVLTALSMRKDAWELGMTNKELEQMLDNMVQHQAERSS